MTGMIQQALEDGIQLRRQCMALLPASLHAAAMMMVDCLQGEGKVLVCGNGGSAADAQHFAAELVNRFERDRPGLAAISLCNDASIITSIANDDAFHEVFARQIQALGRPGDILLAISTSGNSPNILAATNAAHEAGMRTIALTGGDGGELGRLGTVSMRIHIPSASTPRVQEMHITCLHLLCSIIDDVMFGGEG